MRWEDLFADLEAQTRALEQEEVRAEVAERTRGEVAQVALVNRLRATVGATIAVDVWGAGRVQGRLLRVGPDFVLLASVAPSRELVVVLAAVLSYGQLPPGAVGAGSIGPAEARLGVTSALRGIAADRSEVTLALRDGQRVNGTVLRVGADWLDLTEHPPGEPPRAAAVHGLRTVPLGQLAVVQRRTPG
jgi:hypothetical protein